MAPSKRGEKPSQSNVKATGSGQQEMETPVIGAAAQNSTLGSLEREVLSLMTREEKLQWLREEKDREAAYKLEELRMKERIAVEQARGSSPALSAGTDGNEHVEIEKIASKMRACLPRMPTDDAGAVPGWFNAVENIFNLYGVPGDLRGRLLIPFLSERSKGILTRLSLEQISDYEILKAEILEENKLAPGSYLKKFKECRKDGKETWTQFAAKLRDLLLYYWNAKEINSVDRALELCVADQFKEKLSPEAREYVTLVEAKETKTAIELAKLVQKFEEAKNRKEIAFFGNSRKETDGETNLNKNTKVFGSRSHEQMGKNNLSGMNKFRRRDGCHVCGDKSHFKKDCPFARNRQFGRTEKQINRVMVEAGPSTAVAINNAPCTLDNTNGRETNETVISHVARVSAGFRGVGKEVVKPLHTVKINIAGKCADAIIDTGAQISVVHSMLLENKGWNTEGKVKLVGPFGKAVHADIVTLPMSLSKQSQCRNIEILCAVTEELGSEYGCLLNDQDYETLKQAVEEDEDLASPDGDADTSPHGDDLDDHQSSDGDGWLVGNVAPGEENGEGADMNSEEFAQEQKTDTTLERAWQQARQGLGGMQIRKGLLYHRDKVCGVEIAQLVLPKERRKRVLELAHDSKFGGHLGSRKTGQRIRMSFFWPGMADDVRTYCQSCHSCQLRTKPKTMDRTPITPLVRPEAAFTLVNMDIIGPIDPPSARGHKYVLMLVDVNTRWPEAVPLRSLNSRVICDSLIAIFSRTGLPYQVSSDQGGSFTSALTKELANTLKVQLRFSTPEHPNSNGVVERMNGTFKNMLAHFIHEHGKQWDKMIPYLLWAYRETPNETTKMSPYQLLYGRIPTGPLTLLAAEWSGEVRPTMVLDDNKRNFIDEVKARIMEAQNMAKLAAEKQQERYAHNYNLRSTERKFQKGDLVLMLKRHPNNKLDYKWEGPAIVEERVRDNSYKVRKDDGKLKWIHADNLKAYKSRVTAVGVTFADEEEFGDILWPRQVREIRERDMKLMSLII